jgi:hypothetical protein
MLKVAGKYNLSLEGSMSKDKIIKACELMKLELRGQTTNNNDAASSKDEVEVQQNKNWPLWVRCGGLIKDKFPYASLSSTDIQEICEDGYDEPVQLSIISTCLSSYCER